MEQSYVIRNDRVIGKTVPNINYNYSTCPIGSIFAFSSERIPLGFFICDGASYKVAEYPDLYAVIGNTYGGDDVNFNVPDYRETVLVGVGENTTDTIASHDVYELGEFKDDQLQSHKHTLSIPNSYYQYTPTANGGPGAKDKTTAETSNNSGRSGTTTHGKQKGVTYIIKAFHTNEGQDEGVSYDVIDYVDRKINDSEIQTNTTWSSSKINEELEDVRGELDIIVEEANKNTSINDEVESLTTVWSSKKTSDEIAKVETELNANLGELCNKKIYCGEVTGTTVDGFIDIKNPIGKAGNVIATMKYQSNLTPYGYCVTAQSTELAINFYFRWHRESDGAEVYPPDGTEITISYMIFY